MQRATCFLPSIRCKPEFLIAYEAAGEADQQEKPGAGAASYSFNSTASPLGSLSRLESIFPIQVKSSQIIKTGMYT